MATPSDPSEKYNFINSLRHCLQRLMEDALMHDLRVPALHLRIAIIELDEVLAAGERGDAHGGRSAA